MSDEPTVNDPTDATTTTPGTSGDDTDYIQDLVDRDEPLPPGRYVLKRTVRVREDQRMTGRRPTVKNCEFLGEPPTIIIAGL